MISLAPTNELGPEIGSTGQGADFVPIAIHPGQPGEFWLNGKAIFCACPDCRAPMSVRYWLMLAECWRCGATIELTEEQERQIEQLLSPPLQLGPNLVVEAPPIPPPQPEPNLVPESPGASLLPATGVDAWFQEPLLRHVLDVTPAWLVSLLVHLVLFLLLALLTIKDKPQDGPFITLSAVLGRKASDKADAVRIRDVEAKFDMPLPTKADLNNERHRKILLAATQEALELRLDENTPNLPDLAAVKNRVGQADGYKLALAARDPRLRAEMVTHQGGTTLTEAAVARGLRWLANHQNRDGSWSLAGFHHAADCKCTGDGRIRARSPGTALALLPFLGAGQTHLAGRYQAHVSRGLRWLIDHQDDNGDLRFDATGNEGMYAHGQATIVLCEAFGMTGDEVLRAPAQMAIQFIVDAQYNDGGWRYKPSPRNQQGDTSVVGWQLMALQSARSAGLAVPQETWEMADVYLDGVQQREGALYAYQTQMKPSAAMTAEALLCRMYLGWKNERPGLVRGVRWLNENHFPAAASPNMYYWYYGTQVMHHHGGAEWDEWNQRMRDILVATQEIQGHLAGSWRPRGDYSDDGGRVYETALAVCTLEVYYRHLPIFRQIELE